MSKLQIYTFFHLAYILNTNVQLSLTHQTQWQSPRSLLYQHQVTNKLIIKKHAEKMEKRLQNLLKNEYGEVYDEEERTIKEAKKIIAKRNPELASCTPKEAKEVLKVQLDGFLHSRALFNKSLESTQTLRDWWMNIGCQAQKDGNVLAALAVKLYSVCPTSMVDEQQMSVISWLNSPKGNGQWVATIQNLAIIHSVHMLQTKSQQKCPMTVSWCDIKEVIGWHGKTGVVSLTRDLYGITKNKNPLKEPATTTPIKLATTATPAAKVIDITSDDSGTNSEDEDGEDNDVDLLIEDSDKSAMDNMKWVDELAQPAPSTANGSSFDVEEDMDLAGFHYILADEHPKEPSVEGKSTEKRKDGSQEGKGKEKMSATVATEAVDWDAE
ncbi:hypothetical protein Moror_15860 [Moniliophthora roreri MCA 2997]|uniref:Uncharacterized protein n=1 Tax=Moniliophthora roreri (strain MCA 2997) TaxID=1381753 RepID=V2W4G5_MONRO|nr:hypothetical protein Moror_15860 [Moniliophthora roreri MCA 2997]